jgi:isoquinoline 1-oxidoreductase beta subunit
MGRARAIARRGFLIGSVAIAGGIAFGAYCVNRPTSNPLLDGLGEGEAALTPFVKITSDGITLIVPRADVGQGIASTQAMLIAEELDIDPASATLDPGQPHPAYFNGTVAADGLPFPAWKNGAVASSVRDLMITVARLSGSQFAGGSSSTADLHETLRLAGTSALETLKAAAASRTGVAATDLRTEDGHVILPDGARIAYTQLAAEAARIEPVTNVALRPPSEWRQLGKPVQRLDIVAKSTGTQDYGIDVTMPGMLHAFVRANPGRGGGTASYNADAARAMQGVRSVVEVNEALAVIADNTWFAFRAAEALEVEWVASDYPESSGAMWAALGAAHEAGDYKSRLRDDGDIEEATSSTKTLAADYRTPFLAHAALEPLSATVLVEPDQVTIWTATQVPHVVRDTYAHEILKTSELLQRLKPR